MSIATQISRITGLRDRIRTKLLALGVIQDNSADLEDCTDAIEGMSGGGNTTIYRRQVNYTGSSTAQTSISFDVSDFIGSMSQIVLVRVRSAADSWSNGTTLKLWVFETMPNMTENQYLYTFGASILSGGGSYFNSGITVSLTVGGSLAFTSAQAIFVGDFVLECYYTQNNNQVGVVNQSTSNEVTINN